jgi:butyrate response factor 1
MEELRYVLRHPRYKTELCRMVAAGGKCSYAHRCHFRHTLTKEEKAKHFPEATDGC